MNQRPGSFLIGAEAKINKLSIKEIKNLQN